MPTVHADCFFHSWHRSVHANHTERQTGRHTDAISGTPFSCLRSSRIALSRTRRHRVIANTQVSALLQSVVSSHRVRTCDVHASHAQPFHVRACLPHTCSPHICHLPACHIFAFNVNSRRVPALHKPAWNTYACHGYPCHVHACHIYTYHTNAGHVCTCNVYASHGMWLPRICLQSICIPLAHLARACFTKT